MSSQSVRVRRGKTRVWSLCLLTLSFALLAHNAQATAITVCFQSTSYYTNLNSGAYNNGLIPKLTDPANFGPSGTFGTITWTFTNFGSPTNPNLQSTCDIWYSGWETDAQYTAAELNAMNTFVNNGGSVLAGCDDAGHDPLCALFGAPSTRLDHPTSTVTASAEPIACPGEITTPIQHQYWSGTFNTVPAGAQTIANQTGTANPTILLSNNDHVLMFADINMLHDGPISAGTTVTTPNDFFAMRAFGALASSSQGQTPDCVNTLPVSLSYISSDIVEDTLNVSFETSTETVNFGFDLWADVDGRWRRLNSSVIASQHTSSLTPSRYHTQIEFAGLSARATDIAVSSIDLNGHHEHFGPFRIGETFGREAGEHRIDWLQVKQQSSTQDVSGDADQSARQPGRLLSGRTIRRTSQGLLTQAVVTDSGMYELTHAALMDAGVDLRGVPVTQIALTYDGNAHPRHITATRGRWTQASLLRWFAPPVKASRLLHTDQRVFNLERSNRQVLAAKILQRKVTRPRNWHTATVRRNQQNHYDFAMSRPDPWYEKSLRQIKGSSISATTYYDVELSPKRLRNNPAHAHVNMRVVTLTDFGPGVDHIIQLSHVLPNGREVIIDRKSRHGFATTRLKGDVSTAQLRQSGRFRLRQLSVPDELEQGGYPTNWRGAVVNLDSVSLRYPATNRATSDRLTWQMTAADETSTANDGHTVLGFSGQKIVGYAASNTQLWRLKHASTARRGQRGNWSNQFPQVDDVGVRYWFSTPSAFLKPTLKRPVVNKKSLETGDNDYVVIAHPSFLTRLTGKDTEPSDFLRSKLANGHRVHVADYSRIAQVYGHGHHTPRAITDYLKHEKARNKNLTFVLLVGHSSRDPLDHTNNGSFNQIPTYYSATNSVIQYAPNDGKLADLDGDGFQDLAIGRWPVRTIKELNAIIQKTIQFTDGTNRAPATVGLNRALLVADRHDGSNDFAAQMQTIKTRMQAAAVDTDAVYKDNGATSLQLINAINRGYSVTSYSGHAGPDQWSFSGLLNTQDLDKLDNNLAPTLMFLLSCYTTYTVGETVDSMGYRLIADDAGAVGIIGAAGLSSFQDNASFTHAVLNYMLPSKSLASRAPIKANLTLGEAITRAKRQGLSARNAMNVSGNLLGDPSIRLIQ